jgi:signal transduction histidine kinase
VILPVFDIMKVQAQFKNLNLTVKINQDVPKVVNGDSKRLCQVLFSLLGNSVKYTDRGSISVLISAHTEGSLQVVV